MSKYKNIEFLISQLEKTPLKDIIEKFGLSKERLITLLQYLQFLTIKIKVSEIKSEIDLGDLQKIKELGNQITLLENYLFEFWKESTEKSNDLIINSFGIIATLYHLIGELISNDDYIIKSGILYCISEYESNSYIIIKNFFNSNPKFEKLINFDFQFDLVESINRVDIIIFLNILFFSRNFSIIEKFLIRNKEYIEIDDVFKDWVVFFEYIMKYVYSGVNKKEIISYFSILKNNKLLYGNPLLTWIINRLSFHLDSFFNNSIWIIREKLKNIPNNYILDLIHSDIFELWKSQRICLNAISIFGKNNVLLMPTSSGKTLIAEIQTIYHIFNKNKKVLYICPTNALVNQIYHQHRQRFLKTGINSIRITGSYEKTYEIDDYLFKYSQFIIMTPEKLDMMWRVNRDDFLDDFSLIIFDEFQLIEDQFRGLKYELLISRIKNTINLEQLKIDLTFLSACVPHSSITPILKWLGKEKTLELNIDWKPTRTIEGILIDHPINKKIHGITFPNLNNNSIKYTRKKDNFKTIDDRLLFFINFLNHFHPIMIFYENKKGTERIIEKIYKEKKKFGFEKIQDSFFEIQLKIVKNELGFESQLLNFLSYGMTFHHAGLPERVREIIEILIRKGFIKIFACTTTFAEGINFPLHSILFHSLNLYNEENESMELMSYRLYENIIGRAGRALKFSEGLILIPGKDEIAFNFINSELEPLKSIFEILEKEMIENKLEILLNNKTISDIQVDLLSFDTLFKIDIEKYLKNTLYYQNVEEPQNYIIKHLEIQKKFINEFIYPKNTKKLFKDSGLNLLFCKNLYDFIISNDYSRIILEFNTETFIDSREFDEINKWIFSNHPELNRYNIELFKLIKIWINRRDFNFKEIYQYSKSNDKNFFENIRFLNKKIRNLLPWIWSIITKLLYMINPQLSYLKYLPYFIKFGLNSKEKLINIIYQDNKDLFIDKKQITKAKIEELI